MRPMVPRDIDEAHRVGSALELFFDLCFVVAVAVAGASLHGALLADPGIGVVGHFASVFFAVWWGWMNFTWFASAFDTDDVAYRLLTLVQIAGVLVIAAGIGRAFDRGDFVIVTFGYLLMRVGLIAQWMRAAAGHTGVRRTAKRYAAGITAMQTLWLAVLAAPADVRMWCFAPLVCGELAVPFWAERVGVTPWHPGHMVERYGSFTLIVLGESVLAATNGVRSALDAGGFGDIATIAVGGLLIVFSMWWIYFDRSTAEMDEFVAELRRDFDVRRAATFVWGYGHVVVFASAAAVGAGLQVAVDVASPGAEPLGIGPRGAALAVTVPVASFLLSTWVIQNGTSRDRLVRSAPLGVAAVVVLACSLTSEAALTSGVVLVGLVGWMVLSSGFNRRAG